jgi:hypothetical protein
MKNTYFEKFDADNSRHQRYALSISYWSRLSKSILELNPQDIAEHPYGVLAQDLEVNGVLGYIAVKDLHSEGVGQIGALITSPYHRGRNIAHQCIGHILKSAPKQIPTLRTGFAYGNECSTSLFLKHGGVLIGSREPSAPTGCNNVISLTSAMGLAVEG